MRLYRAAFPREERVALDLLLEADGPYDFIACYDGEMLCGFYSTLTMGDITHVLFLAVEETLRGEWIRFADPGCDQTGISGQATDSGRGDADPEAEIWSSGRSGSHFMSGMAIANPVFLMIGGASCMKF